VINQDFTNILRFFLKICALYRFFTYLVTYLLKFSRHAVNTLMAIQRPVGTHSRLAGEIFNFTVQVTRAPNFLPCENT